MVIWAGRRRAAGVRAKQAKSTEGSAMCVKQRGALLGVLKPVILVQTGEEARGPDLWNLAFVNFQHQLGSCVLCGSTRLTGSDCGEFGCLEDDLGAPAVPFLLNCFVPSCC
ncbi:hypothetical protein Taro_049698 [Colocasia esculenta]|uniref:Uncharacterized protein n=1 Tax=Colocasia esculenta TaxID=4460 RepID=A0A843XBG9_COLES|nr:hypothetical protein [Colocasia esculenta]